MLSRLLSLREPAVIAHRGGSKLRPENTLAAFRHAASIGVDALECDVHLSRDGEVVVIHDDTLDRTTDATGPVARFSAVELASIDAGARFRPEDDFPFRGQGLGVPRLVDVLNACPEVPVVIEIKGDRPETARRALEVVRAADAEARVMMGGFSQAVLGEVRRRAPGLVTSASRAEVQSALRRSWLFLAPRRSGYALFQIPLRLRGRQILTRRFVRVARRSSIPVQAWIVDDEVEMRMLLEWGVTGIISDRPDIALAVVGR
jgi:glycerophosphoryl diester phosphodiesterase